jgi:hypothetical protein
MGMYMSRDELIVPEFQQILSKQIPVQADFEGIFPSG